MYDGPFLGTMIRDTQIQGYKLYFNGKKFLVKEDGGGVVDGQLYEVTYEELEQLDKWFGASNRTMIEGMFTYVYPKTKLMELW